MIDFFLRNAGGKMKALARLTIFLSILGAVGLLLAGIFLNDGEDFGLFLIRALGTFSGGWVSGLIFQCLGEAAGSNAIGPVAGNRNASGWVCKCGRVNEPGRGVCPRCGKSR